MLAARLGAASADHLEHAGFTVIRVNHLSMQYDPYGLLHSSLDWVFTRRHFLSDFAKQQVPADVTAAEYARNVAALVAVFAICTALSAKVFRWE